MNINKGLLSICCLGYNHGKFIEENIRSIWNIDYKNIEIIVLDDGSSDNSKFILEKLQSQSPIPMTIILQKNTGNIGYNFNETIKKAKGEYITFISLDDFYKPEAISHVMSLMQKENFAFVASSKIIGIDNNGQISNEVPPLKLANMLDPTIEDLLDLEYEEFGAFYIQGTFFRKEIIDAVKGYDEDMTGDDIILRIKVFRYIKKHPDFKFKILNTPLCFYRQHNSNIHFNSLRQIKIVTEYLDRYWKEKPNPKILIDWMIETIKPMSFKQALKAFSINSRASLLLQEEVIQCILIRKLKKETSLLRYFYYKEKQGDLRIVKIFNFFTIKYHRKMDK